MTSDDETVTITATEYASLKRDSETLGKLERAGVDNWDWYYEALREED